jgi:predicted molibdopterin-dependent oxidoreductase YjgC
MERLWGAPLSATAGLTFEEMVADGKLKALVVLDDNPLMLSPNAAGVRRALEKLEFLAVIDSLPTDVAALAHAVLPETGAWGKEGTTVSADRRVLAMNQATEPHGESRQGWRILSDLGSRLAERLQAGEIRIRYAAAAEVMDEMAQVIPLFKNATYKEMDSGTQQYIDGLGAKTSVIQPVAAPATNGRPAGFTLSTSRSLYLSAEAAAIHSPDADRLHRDDALKINPADATALGIADGDSVVIRNATGELTVRATLTAAVQPKTLHLPMHYDGGAVSRLFAADAAVAQVELARA